MDVRVGGSVLPPAPFIVPDWLSPARVLSLTAPLFREVVIPAATVTVLARPNPMRTGLFIMGPPTIVGSLMVGPYQRPDIGGIALTSSATALAVSLSDWMSLVNGTWYGYNNNGLTIVVAEMVRPYPGVKRV